MFRYEICSSTAERDKGFDMKFAAQRLNVGGMFADPRWQARERIRAERGVQGPRLLALCRPRDPSVNYFMCQHF